MTPWKILTCVACQLACSRKARARRLIIFVVVINPNIISATSATATIIVRTVNRARGQRMAWLSGDDEIDIA
jgi:hypothetical protein